jgi:catechol 2,3-dioxygenase-like lactoylglutathione lyase family enzyme
MKIVGLDHVVLTVRDLDRTIAFYERVLGFQHVVFEGRYNALHFAAQKINLHPYRNEYEPHAAVTLPGTGDCALSPIPTLLQL